MTLSAKKEKQRNQVKSRFYYIFWGAATVTVFVGQMYVGTGFRRMAKSFDRIVDTVVVEFESTPGWGDEGLYNPTNPPIKIY